MIQRINLPSTSLLLAYGGAKGYTDCYATVVLGVVPHADFVTAFYTTWVFKLERLLLKWLMAKPSTDAEAHQLAIGASDDFAAWHVEARAPNQLLMADFLGRTRSWLMVAEMAEQGCASTQLYFGSGVVARHHDKDGVSSLGWGFWLMLGFHKVYSRVLLRAARSRFRSVNRAQ